MLIKENIYKDRILILDFGSQYAWLVARRIREIGIYCELWEWETTETKIRRFNPNGIILSGGPESIIKNNSPRAPQYVFEAGVPVLGICYGMHTMTVQLGGCVKASNIREFGYTKVEIENESTLTQNIKDSLTADGKSLLHVWMSHTDVVTTIPPNFISVARTKVCDFAIIANETKKFYGVQFHPEVTHTCQGMNLLKRFAYEICQCKALWTSKKIIVNIIEHIRQKVGDNKVILGLSGGIDSFVTAMLLHRAIKKNLTCVFVDTGLLRLNEANQVMNMFDNHFGLKIIFVSAGERFFEALKGKNDPEEKRKTIGRVFMEIFNEEALKLKNVKWFAQGTIYSDIIESAALFTSKAHTIKSHHNVGGLPKKMKIGLVEPIKDLFKDEVRKIGLDLNLPYNILYRHPFPGPGLGVRILGEVKREYCDLLRHVDAIFIEELHKANFYDKISQAFAVFLPIRSVSVMGDNRKYDWVISLRAVETVDFMTARWSYLPYELLDYVANRIINEVDGISRVVYDISGKPPATIEWE